MQEHDLNTNEQVGSFDLEQRLRAYYGPQLREQPLSQGTWQHLRTQLGAQEGARRRQRSQRPFGHFHKLFANRRSQVYVPTSIQEAFARIVNEARVPATHASLRRHEQRSDEPVVRLSWMGRRTIRMFHSLHTLNTMGQAELDVLLATGLARSVTARKPAYRLGQLLLFGMLLIACLALIMLWLRHMPLVGFPVALLLCAGVTWLWHIQARSLAFHADMLIVKWLGRSRACSGLHALAYHSQKPER